MRIAPQAFRKDGFDYDQLNQATLWNNFSELVVAAEKAAKLDE